VLFIRYLKENRFSSFLSSTEDEKIDFQYIKNLFNIDESLAAATVVPMERKFLHLYHSCGAGWE